MHVRLVFLVTPLAESEIVALSTVKVEHPFRNRLQALVTAIPQIVAFFLHLVSGMLHSFLLDRMRDLVLEFFFLLLLEGVLPATSLLRILVTDFLVLHQLQIDVTFRLNVSFVLTLVRFVVLFTEHSRHCLVIEVRYEFSFELLLDPID